jgi:hypothetical protein
MPPLMPSVKSSRRDAVLDPWVWWM